MYPRLWPCILSSPLIFYNIWGEERSGRAKRKDKNQRQVLLRFIFRLTYQMCFLLCSFCPERVHFTLWNRLQKTPEFYNLLNFSKPDLSSGAHMGNQKLPSIPAASSLSVWKMCAGASPRSEITPLGGQGKGSQPKDVTWIPLSVPSFVMTLLHSSGTT